MQVEIKATDVKALREKTGAGMMDCKNALVQANGDFARAEKILKELGLAAAQKRAGRATKEGRIFSRIADSRGALLELTCETDFVAKNKGFIALGESLSQMAISKGVAARPEDFSGQVQDAVGKIKENITLRRLRVLEAGPNDLIMSYIHGEGKIGVMVKFNLSDSALRDNPRVQEVAFDLALHTAAFAPLFLDRRQVPEDYVKEQEEIFTKQAEKLGKPENVVKGIVQGKLNKHLAEICFVDQAFVKDPNLRVTKVLDTLNREIGGKVEISDYLYYKVGEEVE
jgi:elongation factor Ts